MKRGGGYILHTRPLDPAEVDYETLKYFFEHGREMSRKFYSAR